MSDNVTSPTYFIERGVIICNRLCIALSSERYKRGLLGGQYLWQTLAFANPQKPPNTLYILGQLALVFYFKGFPFYAVTLAYAKFKNVQNLHKST